MSTVALTIDYSNGAQKHFSRIPWKKGMTILGAIEATERIAPGAAINYGSDRSGHVLGLVIDGLPSKEGSALEWDVWINARKYEGRIGTATSFGFHPDEREGNLLDEGDCLLLKLAAVPEKSK